MKKNIWIPLGILAGAMLLFGLITATAPYWGKAAQQEESAAADQLVEKEETPAPDLPEQAEKEEKPAPEQPEKPAQEKEPIKEEDSKYDSLFPKSETPITEEQAIKIAYEHGVDMYGSKMEEFSFENCRQSLSGVYDVSFSKRYGKDGYILGPIISISVNEYGEFYGVSNRNTPEFDALDPAILESFDKADVEAFVAKKINERYHGAVKKHDIYSVQLLYDEKFYLAISVDLTFSNHCDVQQFDYDFPQ
ncbi:MAG: hypothetical protein IJN34_06560 [Clostridia bacterium]|nr:hypothetical protein [Clostridia bacterium]